MAASGALTRPLLGGKASNKPPPGLLDEGSTGSSAVLLCSAAIGTGVLALPYGASCVGVLPALAIFAVAGFAAYAANVILFLCVKETGLNSYGDLMTGIIGTHGATVLDLFVCLEGVGAVATYLVFIMDYVPQICAIAGDDAWCTDRGNVAVLAAMIIWPLSCFKGLSALRYISTCSIVTIFFTSFVVVVKAPGRFASLDRPFSEAVTEMHLGAGTFQVLSMACFAFMTHTNTPEIASQFLAPSSARINQVVGFHTVALWTVYCAIAVCGFLSFQDGISQDFLTNYEIRDVLVVACRCMLSATLVCACPINLFPAMQALFNVLDRLRGQSDSLYDSAISRIPVTTTAFAISLGIAIRTPHVADLISMLSAFLSAPLMFAFPAMMYCKILRGKNLMLPGFLVFLTVALWLAESARLLGFS